MTDIAELGLKVDSSQAKSGAVNLDALASSAANAEKQVKTLAPTGEAAASAHAKISTQSMAATHALRGMAEQISLGVSPVQALTAQMSHLSYAASAEGGLVGALKGVGSALAPMLTLPNLITAGVIGLAVAIPAIYDAFAGSGAQDAEAALKRQKSLIDDIAKSWPEAAAGLKDYLDQASRRTQNEAIVATREQITAASKELAKLTDQLNSATFSNMTGGGRSGPTNSLAYIDPETRTQLQGLVHDFEAGSISAAALRDDIARLELPATLDDRTRAVLASFSALADKIGVADATAHAFSSTLEKLSSFDILGSDFNALAGVGNSVVDQLRKMAPDLRTEKQKATDTYTQNSALDFDGSIKKQLDYTLKQIDQQKAIQDATTASRQAASQAKAHAAAIDGVTSSLKDQLNQLHETDREQFISQQLSRAKTDATTKEGRAITSLAEQYYDQKAAVDALNATMKDIDQAGQSLTEGFFSTLKSDLKNGVGLWQSFGDAASSVIDSLADKALKMAADGIWNSIFGAITGGISGGVGAAALGRTVAPTGFDFASFLNGHAAGGSIRGAGTSTSDSIPAMLSDGEYVINARAASQNRSVLDWINGGGDLLRRFDGGMIAPGGESGPELTWSPA